MLKLFFKLAIAAFTIIIFFVNPVFAAENIESFDSNITLHKDGTMDVIETILYDFGKSQRHGIYRYIPIVSKVGDLFKILDIKFYLIKKDGVVEQAQSQYNSDQAYVKIGNPRSTLNGSHQYQIGYHVKGAITNYKDHDELFWNVTGNSWDVAIATSSALVKTDFNTDIEKSTCYTGNLGSKEQYCTSFNKPSYASFSIIKPLLPGQGFSVVTSFPANTFPKTTLSSKQPAAQPTDSSLVRDILKIEWYIKAMLIFCNLILAPLLLIWYLKFKHKSRFGKPVVNFDIPKDDKGKRISPAQAGTIDTASLEKNDVVATIFDLAIRKYIKIEQIKPETKILTFEISSAEFVIAKIKDYQIGELLPFERELLDRLFQDGNKVEVASLKEDFYQTFAKIEEQIFTLLVAKRYFTKNPKVQRYAWLFLTLASAWTLNFLLALVFFLLYKKLIGRTKKGDELDFRIDGLKIFLKSMSREYKWQAQNQYFVEKMIPYAMALGYIEKYMDQLRVNYPDYSPTWYGGNLAFYSVSTSMVDSFNSGFATASPSSSGFSGGGSGGGGGGGGGGSW